MIKGIALFPMGDDLKYSKYVGILRQCTVCQNRDLLGNGVTTSGVSILHRHSLKIFLKTTVIIFYDILYELHVFGRVFWKNFKVFSTTLCTYFVYLSEAEVYVEQISCVACESHVIFFMTFQMTKFVSLNVDGMHKTLVENEMKVRM